MGWLLKLREILKKITDTLNRGRAAGLYNEKKGPKR